MLSVIIPAYNEEAMIGKTAQVIDEVPQASEMYR